MAKSCCIIVHASSLQTTNQHRCTVLLQSNILEPYKYIYQYEFLDTIYTHVDDKNVLRDLALVESFLVSSVLCSKHNNI